MGGGGGIILCSIVSDLVLVNGENRTGGFIYNLQRNIEVADN